MKRVRRQRTRPEDVVARALRERGLSYRRNVRSLPGSPDFANKRAGWAIFVMGCFWHHHTACRRAGLPARNRAFWAAKFADNRRRDAAKVRALRRAGFRVLLLWECAILDVPEQMERKLDRLAARRHPPKARAGTPAHRGDGAALRAVDA
ncbi:MAG: very short patch repair endonuclease [Geminicoccaceae bacterium]|nr:very short patch repair endonuclease [Geminicoccaceae bacterium]